MSKNDIFPYSDTDENRWRGRLAFVDMYFEIKHQEIGLVKGYIRRNGGGLAAQGYGETVGDAIRNASVGENIDWNSVDRKITEQAWKSMAHL